MSSPAPAAASKREEEEQSIGGVCVVDGADASTTAAAAPPTAYHNSKNEEKVIVDAEPKPVANAKATQRSNNNDDNAKEPRGTTTKQDDDVKDNDPPPAKRMRTNNNETVVEEKQEKEQQEEGGGIEEEILDICEELGFKPGDRFEVEWQLQEPGGDDDNGAEKLVNKWWGCKLLPHDGKSEDGVAIRVLEYDPYPEGGFPDRSQEDVVFLSHEILISPESCAEFRYRPEGVIQLDEEQARETINTILMGALQKHNVMWNKLDRAQQSKIAAGIAQKKEQLVEAMMSHTKSHVISGEDMVEMLQGIMKK